MRQFPHKHAWLAAHNDDEAADAMKQNDFLAIKEKENMVENQDEESNIVDADEFDVPATVPRLRPLVHAAHFSLIPPLDDVNILQLDEGLSLAKPKKPTVHPAIPERFSGFKEDPRYWADSKTSMRDFCKSHLYSLCTYVLMFILVIYWLSFFVQLGLGLCSLLAHLLAFDHDPVNGPNRQ